MSKLLDNTAEFDHIAPLADEDLSDLVKETLPRPKGQQTVSSGVLSVM